GSPASAPPAEPPADQAPDILFISGSPRRRASVALIGLLEQGARKAGARTQHFYLCEKHIDPCIGCGSCEKTGVCILAKRKKDGHPVDDYLELKDILDRVDAVGIVAPIYFAGPTAQFKALMDRFQPYFTKRYLLGHKPAPKRPAQLYIIGAGGDDHGYAPLIGITRSSFNVAGFSLEKVHDFVGFLHPKDRPKYPEDDDPSQYAASDLLRRRRILAQQLEFEQRALSASGAFARYVVKQQEAQGLADQLAVLKSEMEQLNTVGDDLAQAALEDPNNPDSPEAAAYAEAEAEAMAMAELTPNPLLVSGDAGLANSGISQRQPEPEARHRGRGPAAAKIDANSRAYAAKEEIDHQYSDLIRRGKQAAGPGAAGPGDAGAGGGAPEGDKAAGPEEAPATEGGSGPASGPAGATG
ncbi:MAG: flavodoxin family protein, partial [Coriobacteriia bacterium]|nr:flavodoxin family protein [Coriobacteriia bacterium]